MASGRIAVGGLATAAVVLALVVAGCGGGGSSASGTAGGGSSTAAGAGSDTEASAASKPEEGASSAKVKSSGETPKAGVEASPPNATAGANEKKHPSLQLPTGKPEHGPTKKQLEAVPTADIKVAVKGGALSAANTCKGKNLSPALEWHQVPAGTEELALFVMNLQPVNGKLYFDWAVAGIDPSLDGLEAGEVPKGAIVGRNSAGKNDYSLCPQGSAPENYVFALYAIPKSLSPKTGFDPLELRKEATAVSDSVGLYSVAY